MKATDWIWLYGHLTIPLQFVSAPCFSASLDQKNSIDQQTSIEEVTVFGENYGVYREKHAVSATRTLTAIEEIPQSIAIISNQLIRDQQPTALSETLRNVGSVVINQPLLIPAFDNTLIRGFAAEQYVDGFTQYYNPGDRDSLINVERIEVLKGSNGLLYGGGSGTPIGGMVNIVSKQPEAETSMALVLKAGSNGFAQLGMDINTPVNDALFARVTGEYTQSNSDIEHLGYHRYNVNPAVRYQPTDQSNVIVRLKHSRWQGQDYQGLPAYGTVLSEVKINPWLFVGHPDIEESRSEFDAVELKADVTLNQQWQATTQWRAAQSSFEENVQTLSGGGFDFGADLPVVGPPALAQHLGLGQLPFALYNARLAQTQEEVSGVTNAMGSFDVEHWQHTLLFGADYSEYHDQGYLHFAAVDQDFIVDLANPDFRHRFVAPEINHVDSDLVDHVVGNTVYGLYAQWQGSLHERLHLLMGLRYGTVTINFRSPDNVDRTHKQRVIPRVGAVFDINESLSLFAGLSEGMRGQAFANFVTQPEPETSRQREAGVKFNWGEEVSGQMAFFEIDRRHVAVPTPNPNRDGGFGVVPEGRQASRGVDTEMLWQPNPHLSVLGSYSYVDTRFKDDLFSFANDGDDLPGVPEHSARLWCNYDFLGGALQGLRLGAGVYRQTGTLISLRNHFYADSFTLFDASASYHLGRHSLELSVKNATNAFYYDRLNYLGGRVAPGQKRAVFLSWRYEG